MRGFAAQMVDGTGAAAKRASGEIEKEFSKAGQDAGKAAAAGIKSAVGDVQAASKQLADARKAEGDAAKQVQAAEKELAGLRKSGTASADEVSAAEGRLESAHKAVSSASAQTVSAQRELSTAHGKLATESEGAASAARKLAEAQRKEQDAAGKVAVAEEKLSDLQASGKASSSQLEAATQSLERAKSGLATASDRTAAAEANLASESDKAAASAAKMADRAEESGDAMRRADDGGKSFGSTLLDLGKKAGAAAIAFAGIKSIGSIFGDAISRASDTVAAEQSLSGLYGSAEDAADMMDRIGNISSGSKIDTGAYTEMAQSLGYLGVKGAQSEGIMRNLGKAIVGAGGDSSAFDTVSASLTKMQNEGKVTRESLNQLSGAGVPILDSLATKLGKEVPDVLDMVSNGLVDVDDVLGVLEDGTGQWMERLIEAGGEVDNTFGARWARAKDTVMEALGTAILPVLERLSPVISGVADGVTWLIGAFTSLGDNGNPVIDAAAAAWGYLKDGIGTAKDVLAGTVDVLANVVGWMDRNKTAVITVASIIGTVLLPALVTYGIQQTVTAAKAVAAWVAQGAAATVEAAKNVAAWVTLRAQAVGSAAAQVAASWRVVAGWVAAGASAVAQGAVIAAAWIGAKAQAVGSFIAMGASATVEAAKSAAAWVASSARTVAALVAQSAGFVASKAVMIAGAVATGVMTAAQWALNSAFLANPITWIVALIVGLVAAIVLIATKTTWFQDIWSAVWDAVSAAWDWVWDKLSTGFGYLKDGFQSIADKVGEVKDWILGKWDAIVEFVTGLPSKISSAASGMWDGIKDGFKSVVNTVIGWWNGMADKLTFKIPNIPGVPMRGETISILPHIGTLARGGVAGVGADGRLYGPGTGTSDSILGVDDTGWPTARVSAGEFVVNEKATRANLPLLQAINGQALATGGLVDAQDWARGESGKPYQYAGVGNPSWDCSSYMSGIYAVLTGQDPYARHFTTESDFEALGFVPGLGGTNDFSIGVYRGGGGPNSHMAGTLGDLNVEAGANGVIAGVGAQGAADFPLTWHLPLEGDPGGMPNGDSTIDLSGITGDGASAGVTAASGGGSDPGGDTVRVYVTNWPAGGVSSGASLPSAASSGVSVSSTPTMPSGGGVGGTQDADPYGFGLWVTDPAAAVLDALFEVLDIGDVFDGEQVATDTRNQFGIPAPVVPGSEDEATGGPQVVGTVVNGDVHVTDYDEFADNQERDMNALVGAGGVFG